MGRFRGKTLLDILLRGRPSNYTLYIYIYQMIVGLVVSILFSVHFLNLESQATILNMAASRSWPRFGPRSTKKKSNLTSGHRSQLNGYISSSSFSNISWLFEDLQLHQLPEQIFCFPFSLAMNVTSTIFL